MWMFLFCIQSSGGSESCISFVRAIHLLHCTDVYLEVKLKGHEVQSVASTLMMRNLRVFYLKLEPLYSARECACMA